MSSLPMELEESATMDGATLFQKFWRVIVPLSTPGIVTVGVFKFLGFYNNFLAPFIYLSDPKKYPIAVQMYSANKQMEFTADWVTLFAGVTIAMVPSIIFISYSKTSYGRRDHGSGEGMNTVQEVKAKYKLIALDLDGTLLTDEKRITEETKSGFNMPKIRALK